MKYHLMMIVDEMEQMNDVHGRKLMKYHLMMIVDEMEQMNDVHGRKLMKYAKKMKILMMFEILSRLVEEFEFEIQFHNVNKNSHDKEE